MKIIKRVSDNVVIFKGDDLGIQGRTCTGKDWIFVSMVDIVIENVTTLPIDFVGNGWTYIDGVWTANSLGTAFIAEQAAITTAVAKKATLDSDTKNDGDLAQLRAMSSAEINDWFDLNVTTLNQCIKLLKKVVKSLGRKDNL